MPLTLDSIRENYRLAREQLPVGHKSAHWDVFPADYDKAFDHPEAWPLLLRNALTVGFNDDFFAFCDGGNLAPDAAGGSLWQLRHSHNYRPLLPETLSDPKQLETVGKLLNLLLHVCGREFIPTD